MKIAHPLVAKTVLSAHWAVIGVCALAAPALMAQTQVGLLDKSTDKAKHHATLGPSSGKKVKVVAVAEAALTPAELAIAQRVEVGIVKCELGNSVEVVADPNAQGYFNVTGKKFRFRMAPVVSSTGAIRLEDAKAGAVWLQLANKSMLMNQKLGSRLADACVTPAQALVAVAMEKTPSPSLLDAPVLAVQPPQTPSVALSNDAAQ